MNDDASLLRRFTDTRAEDAFAELVRRHLNLVYFAALRQTHNDTHQAEDAAQATFTLLAQKAGSLVDHPNLAGWLHTAACNQARELMRAEQRRIQREQIAHVMHELTAAEANDAAWTQIRPVIDDALADLAPNDREAVLLRFFENRPYSEIGDMFSLGENAARMRVNRALEQLETALTRRGVKSTATALATALSVPAALAAPAQLGVTITTTALAATAAVGTATTAITFFKIMSSAKLIATSTTIAALAAIGTAVYQNQQLQSVRAEAAEFRQQQADLKTQLTSLESRLATEKKRADDADADNGGLLAAMAAAKIEQNKSAAPKSPLSHDMVMARYKNAQELAKSGQNEEALKEFLWCYDTGMPSDVSFLGVRASYLLSALAKLAKTYPPALSALQERRDAAEQRVRDSADDRQAAMDYTGLNRALGENQKTLALFDSLPADDQRRKGLVSGVSDQLLTAQRYADLVKATPYSRMTFQFATLAGMIDSMKTPPEKTAEIKSEVAKRTTNDIEALAGANQLDNANKLIGKLLEFDNSAETRAKIQTHLARAGHPELLKTP